jgi:KDO2-lipid IV(A) lauroyltransferase
MPGSYRTALRAARAAAIVLPELLPRTTAVVRDNLRLAYGRPDDGLMRAVYRHFAEATTDFAFFRKLFDPARFERHFRFVGGGLEHYRETRPPAAVFATGHFGNWELYGAAFRHVGIPIAPVARPPGNSWLARVVASFRADQGQQVIPKRNALPLAMKALRRGVCVAFLMDQAAGRHGIPVPFFGRPASTYTAPAALALKLGLPLYAGYSTRVDDGIRYRCFAEPVSTEGDVETVTTRLNALLESYVRARPEQWWWFHRRFKPRRRDRQGVLSGPAGVPATS